METKDVVLVAGSAAVGLMMVDAVREQVSNEEYGKAVLTTVIGAAGVALMGWLGANSED